MPRSARSRSTIFSRAFRPNTGSNATSIVPRQQAESEIVEYFQRRRAEKRHRLRQLSRRGRLSPLPARHYRCAGPARRIPHQLHALPGRNYAGHAASDLRIPDHDRRADRHGCGQRQHVRRVNRRGRSGDDGRPRNRAAARPSSPRPFIPNIARCSPPTRSIRACRRRSLATTRRPAASILTALDAAVTEETAAVLVQSPNFFGVIEDIPAIAAIAHAKGALLDRVDCRSGLARHRSAAG